MVTDTMSKADLSYQLCDLITQFGESPRTTATAVANHAPTQVGLPVAGGATGAEFCQYMTEDVEETEPDLAGPER